MTLTQTAILTKNFIIFSAITLIVSIAGYTSYKIWYTYYYLPSLPPVEEKPDTKFGVLPYPEFPSADVSSSNFSFSLDTTTGGFPKFEKLIKVYFMPQPFASLLSGEKSKSLAKKFNITTEPEVLSETEYLFKEDIKSLRVNLDSGNFIYQNEATKSGEEKLLAKEEELTENFKNLLQSFNLLPENFAGSKSKINLLKVEEDDFTAADSQSEAQAAKISIWPQDLDLKPIITDSNLISLVNAVITNFGRDLEDYFEINYTVWPIDTETFATYPLKPAETAFADLQSGKGIVITKPNKQTRISITSVVLAYFLPKNYSPYLQPVFVFEGPEFIALVPATVEQFLDQATQSLNTPTQ